MVKTLPRYCEANYDRLAKEDPADLLRLISETEDPVVLTFALEHLGNAVVDDRAPVTAVLLRGLKHASAVVREGAIYGLRNFFADHPPPSELLAALRSLAFDDPSKTIREIADDAFAWVRGIELERIADADAAPYFIAWYTAIPRSACSATGDSKEEAIMNLSVVCRDVLAHCLSRPAVETRR